jgi:hypothetical protein
LTPDGNGTVLAFTASERRGMDLPPACAPAGALAPAQSISVRAVPGGWCVGGEDLEPLVFRRGRHAELQARALAEGFARLGLDARVTLYDRQGRLAGAIDYFGVTAPPTTPSRAYPWRH